jgi:hypothetical protein
VSDISKYPIKGLANAMKQAQSSLVAAGIRDAILVVRAPALTVAEILESRRAGEILEMGNVVQILVRGSDGWVRF